MTLTSYRLGRLAVLISLAALCPCLAAAESPPDPAQIVDRIIQD